MFQFKKIKFFVLTLIIGSFIASNNCNIVDEEQQSFLRALDSGDIKTILELHSQNFNFEEPMQFSHLTPLHHAIEALNMPSNDILISDRDKNKNILEVIKFLVASDYVEINDDAREAAMHVSNAADRKQLENILSGS